MKKLEQVVFSMEQFKVLNDALGEIPMKYSAPIANFLNKIAQEQHEILNAPKQEPKKEAKK